MWILSCGRVVGATGQHGGPTAPTPSCSPSAALPQPAAAAQGGPRHHHRRRRRPAAAPPPPHPTSPPDQPGMTRPASPSWRALRCRAGASTACWHGCESQRGGAARRLGGVGGSGGGGSRARAGSPSQGTCRHVGPAPGLPRALQRVPGCGPARRGDGPVCGSPGRLPSLSGVDWSPWNPRRDRTARGEMGRAGGKLWLLL